MKCQILVVNCGSSSVKTELFTIAQNIVVSLATISADRIGQKTGLLKVKTSSKSSEAENSFDDIEKAITVIHNEYLARNLLLPDQLVCIAHRVVHGGKISAPAIVTDELIQAIEQNSIFAPIHNPLNLRGIRTFQKLYDKMNIAVFDTAFHATIPEYIAAYALPADLAKKYEIKRYGFHGTSHEYVSREISRRMNIPYNEFSCITLHLGNGASACAIQNGKSIETSMGLTPLEGLVMGTRSGDLDPALVLFLQQQENLSASQTDDLLNKKSGLLGICGSSDMRDILAKATAGEKPAVLARDMFCHRIKKYLGAYMAVLGKFDAIIFTGGIGENSADIRSQILKNLNIWGISLSPLKNSSPQNHNGLISDGSVPVYVCETDEEKMIAQSALSLSSSSPK